MPALKKTDQEKLDRLYARKKVSEERLQAAWDRDNELQQGIERMQRKLKGDE